MRLSTLYDRLQMKGYEHSAIDQFIENQGGWNVLCNTYVRDQMELDRRRVFMTWYGDRWQNFFSLAVTKYINANIPMTIEYILNDD